MTTRERDRFPVDRLRLAAAGFAIRRLHAWSARRSAVKSPRVARMEARIWAFAGEPELAAWMRASAGSR